MVESESTIKNSHSSASIEGTGYVGGLVGSLEHSTIEQSYAKGSVRGVYILGGIAGWIDSSSSIKNSYAAGDATHINGLTGGLVGWNQGSIENSYAIVDLVQDDYVGGLIGMNQGSIANSFFDTQTSGQTVGIGGDGAAQTGVTGKTTAQMQDKATYDGWAIEEDSTVEKGTPFLAWQKDGNSYTQKWVIGTKSVTPDPEPTPDPTPDPVDPTPPTPPSPDPVDPTPPKPDPVVEQETVEAQKVIITIVNDEATKVVVPKVDAATTNLSSVNVASLETSNKSLISQPADGQASKSVSLSEAKEMQVEAGNDSAEVRVPLSKDSIIQLVDGGVSLPEGVEQEFYMADGI